MSETNPQFPAYLVRSKAADATEGSITDSGAVQWLTVQDLPSGSVEIDVACSSLNYKDALACQGHPGVVGSLPHVPGIDCAGTVSTSASPQFQTGDPVLVTGYDLGSAAWGGYSARVRVPADWVVPLPEAMTPEQAMIYGTAGFTAAQAVAALLRNGADPTHGPLLVTGSSGGVGIFSVAILAKLGFEVVAMSGKAALTDELLQIGARRVIDREGLASGDRPLLKAVWGGGIDTVGGATLARLIRSTRHRGCVAACGLVAGAELPLSVYPFILRGVTLAGIDSAKCPWEPRLEVWRQLAGDWAVTLPPDWLTTISLDGLAQRVAQMLAGETFGRTLVVPTTQQPCPAI